MPGQRLKIHVRNADVTPALAARPRPALRHRLRRLVAVRHPGRLDGAPLRRDLPRTGVDVHVRRDPTTCSARGRSTATAAHRAQHEPRPVRRDRGARATALTSGPAELPAPEGFEQRVLKIAERLRRAGRARRVPARRPQHRGHRPRCRADGDARAAVRRHAGAGPRAHAHAHADAGRPHPRRRPAELPAELVPAVTTLEELAHAGGHPLPNRRTSSTSRCSSTR